jgi:hypothetical protein
MESTPGLPGIEMSPALPTLPIVAPLFRLDVVVNDPKDVSLLLDHAVHRLIPTALERRQGILVTQVFPNTYTVEVNETVRCGVVQEKRTSPDIP